MVSVARPDPSGGDDPGAARSPGALFEQLGIERQDFLGCPIDDISFDDTRDAIAAAARGRRACRIVTANVHFVVRAVEDPGFAALLREADLVVADGVPMLWAARLLGLSTSGRVNGTDLVEACAALSAREGWTIGLLGGLPGAAAASAARLEASYPGCRITVIDAAEPIGAGPDPALADRIRGQHVAVLLVALGVPKQELWLRANLEASGAKVGIGVGSALDLLGGRFRRAPLWMQRHGLEWLHRAAQEPGRLGPRYLYDGGRLALLLARALVARRMARRPPADS